jgi:hypothetical protein
MMVVAALGQEEIAVSEQDVPALRPLRQQAAEAVRVRLEQEAADDDGWRAIRVILEIDPEFHLQANPAGADYLVPTAVTADGLELRDLEYPVGEELRAEFSGELIQVYSGSVSIGAQARGQGTLQVTWQACSETGCLPPVRVDIQTGTVDTTDG